MIKKKKTVKFVALLFVIILLLGLTACEQGAGGSQSAVDSSQGDTRNASGVNALSDGDGAALKAGSSEALILSDTDYSDKNNWAAFTDSPSKDVDAFLLYPTFIFSEAPEDRPYARLDSELMRDPAMVWIEDYKGLVSDTANIYAPFYKQLNAIELDGLTSETLASFTKATPREDVFAAFDYFLTHVNKGERPFIILGHSQGAQLTIELATTFLGNEKYYEYNKNHIISYAIGCSVTQEEIFANPNLKFSEAATDTGVIVSWNTTAPSEVESGAYKNFGTWKDGALMTNPLSWETNETEVPAKDNAPFGANAIVNNEHHVLLTTTIPEEEYPPMSAVISRFHGCDIPFYYDSIKQNVKDRVAAF